MATKKLIWIVASFLMISASILSFSFQTEADQQATPWPYPGVGLNENDTTSRHYVWDGARPSYGPWDKIQLHRHIEETANRDYFLDKRHIDSRTLLCHNSGTWKRETYTAQNTETSRHWYFEDYNETVTVRSEEKARVYAKLEELKTVSQGKPGEEWKDPVTGMEFVWVPGGCFQMGSNEGDSDEKPFHRVCVDGFWMGKYEVTNAEYRRYLSGHNSKDYDGKSLNGDNQPAVFVRWIDTKGFIEWLNRENGDRFTFRLPTEAEWEYACRAGTKTPRFWGNDPSEACGYANVHDSTSKRVNKFDWENHNCDDGYAVTSPVGSFKPNGFDLYDMLGNVWEWCEDIASGDAYSQHELHNPINTSGGRGPYRIIRGGSWFNAPRNVRCAYRRAHHPFRGSNFIGFRLVRTH